MAAVEFLEEAPPSIDNWEAMSDEPPPIMDDDELTAEAESWDHIEAIESLASLEAMDGAPPPIPGSETGFSTNELAAFDERIGTFNNIFRIIFETFSAHLGEQATAERFIELVTSEDREQAALFAGLKPEADGTLRTDSLITNLAGLNTDDLDDLLKGGLYELLFSHLSDSKDLLPGDAEATMMERLVVFERQLNQP